MKIYIAGRYSRRDEFREVKKQLESYGHRVTSSWLNETTPLKHTMKDLRESYARTSAIVDLRDIDDAVAVLFFAEDPDVGTPRGGRHVEFGYALAKDKWIYVIGPRENIFHYASPSVINIPNVEYLAPIKALEW